jgi:2-polyprenyl-6-methoxyphenol hydroxylase-like FAD-dependent oxidoreductase
VGHFAFQAANFKHVPAHCKFVALMPQWDFLSFLSERAKRFRSFQLRMQHEATGLVYDRGRVAGVDVRAPQGSVQILSDVVIGCDGRHSTTRRAAEFEVREFGVPIDVLWFRIGRSTGDPEQLLGNINYGKALILINRGDYFQAGLIIPKGSFEEIKRKGLEAFQTGILQNAPYLGDRVQALNNWDQIKLLSVQINRLGKWSCPGLLCIGDAAHAMSPAGGVGINLAIQDAVATANLLAGPLREGRVSEALLAEVQRRREFPTRVIQAIQVNAHRGLKQAFRNPGLLRAPWQLKVAVRVPGVQRVVARVVGIGIRPEHIQGASQRPGFDTCCAKAIAACAGIAAAVFVLSASCRRAQR